MNRAEERTVLLALEDAPSHRLDGYKWPERVASATPLHMGRTAEGKLAQPMGVRKVRSILNALVESGCAERIRSHFGGHAWKITDKGRIARGARRGNAERVE